MIGLSHKKINGRAGTRTLPIQCSFSIYPTANFNLRFSYFSRNNFTIVFYELCTCEKLNAVIRFLSLCEVTFWLHICLCRYFNYGYGQKSHIKSGDFSSI